MNGGGAGSAKQKKQTEGKRDNLKKTCDSCAVLYHALTMPSTEGLKNHNKTKNEMYLKTFGNCFRMRRYPTE